MQLLRMGLFSRIQNGEIHRGVGLVLQLLKILNQTGKSAFYEIEASGVRHSSGCSLTNALSGSSLTHQVRD